MGSSSRKQSQQAKPKPWVPTATVPELPAGTDINTLGGGGAKLANTPGALLGYNTMPPPPTRNTLAQSMYRNQDQRPGRYGVNSR